MTLEAAAKGIDARKNGLAVVVQDENGDPVPGAKVAYHQTGTDFVKGYAQGAPVTPFPYPSYHAGIDIGYESIYGVVVWSKVSPQEGVYDFSSYDADFSQWKQMGYDVTACLAWMGSDNIPAWVQGLGFTELKQQVAAFVKKAVEHFTGQVKFLNIAVELQLFIRGGSRYVSVEYKSDNINYVQPGELIELIRAVFQAAREVNSDILLGYYGVTDFNYSSLNVLPLAHGRVLTRS